MPVYDANGFLPAGTKMSRVTAQELLNIENIAKLGIASKIVNDLTPGPYDQKGMELREKAMKAIYRLMQNFENLR